MQDFITMNEEREKQLENSLRARENNELSSKLKSAGMGAYNATLGAGHEIGEMSTGLLRMLGVNANNAIPKQDDFAFNVGRAVPPMALAYMSGGLGNAASKIPAIAKNAPAVVEFLTARGLLPSVIKNAMGGAAYGATTGYEDRTGNALLDAGIAGIGGMIAPAARGLGNVFRSGTPNKQAKGIIESLSHGAKNVEDNSAMLIKEMRQARSEAAKKARPFYQEVAKSPEWNKLIPKKDISKIIHGSGIESKMLPSGSAEALEKLLENPSIAKMHLMQSQLGKDIAKNNITNSILDRSTVDKWVRLKDVLERNISKKLGTDLAKTYSKASDIWKQEYIPYVRSNAARKLTEKVYNKEQLVSKKNIHNLFSSPGADTFKVMQDLGKQGNDRVLYSKFGNLLNESSPAKKLTEAMGSLEKDQLTNYANPEFKKQISELEKALYKFNILRNVSGAAAITGLGAVGYHAGKHLPHIGFGE